MSPDEEALRRALEARGCETDPERIAAVAEPLRSLRERLLRLREALPAGAEPPPAPLSRARS